MFASTILIVLTALTSLLAVNGAVVVERQATFTFLTPQPTTSSSQSAPPTSSTSPTSTSTGTGTSTSTSISTTGTSSSPSTTSGTLPVTTSGSSSPTTEPSKTNSPSCSATSVPPPSLSRTSTSPSPSATSGGGANCNGIQQWQAAFAYNAGEQVIFNGQLYTAKQWTYNNAPPSHADQWTAGGNCGQPINNQANCNGVGAWQNTVAYTSGNKATFNGHLWSAVQWTQSNAPGDTSGTWKDLGACA